MYEQASISDIADVVTGKTPSTQDSGLWEPDIATTDRHVSNAVKDRYSKQVVPAGSVCVSCIGNLGYVGVTEVTSLTNQQINTIVPNDPCDSDYLYYAMRWLWPYFKHLEGQSTTLSIINKSQFKRTSIPWPNQRLRQRISDILNRFDDMIELNLRTNDYLAELCELIVSRSEAIDGALSDICTQVTDKVSCTEAQIDSYVSTESLLADKNGRQLAASVPQTGKVVVYKAGDTLVSNIRPYFKKIWFAENDGTCSGDVVVFRANNPSLAPYLYAILRSDKFFDYVMSGAKGTKMPRGDKKQMMSYGINPYCPERDLEIIAFAVYGIGVSNQENQYLSALRDSLLPKLMSGEIDTSKVELPTLPNNHLV